MTPQDRADEGGTFPQLHDAFRRGDLDALRSALGQPELFPRGPLPHAIGSCLVYAIYHSPLPFIRTLLELGADPNVAADDGFPSLIAALSCARDAPGAPRRSRHEVEDILRLLLSFGADPNQRGISDYTPLHMAVAERAETAIPILIAAGADPTLRTRIDDQTTPVEMAIEAGMSALAFVRVAAPQALPRRLRPGLTLLADRPGDGDVVRRRASYRIRLRLWLNRGEAVAWPVAWGPIGTARLEDNGRLLITEVRIDRRTLVAGLFYGIEGMRVGGTRRLEIAPRLAYGERGVPDVIPSNAVLTAEIAILGERFSSA